MDDVRNEAVRVALLGEHLVDLLNRREYHQARQVADEVAELAAYIAAKLTPPEAPEVSGRPLTS